MIDKGPTGSGHHNPNAEVKSGPLAALSKYTPVYPPGREDGYGDPAETLLAIAQS
jgi:hypothetical protein